MTIPAQSADVSLALQPGKVGKNGTFDHTDLSYSRVSVVRAGFGPVQDSQTLPPETGAAIVPRGEFKQLFGFDGDADLLPRIESTLGLMLLGVLGNVTTSENQDVNGNVVTGLHTHRFKFHPSSSYKLPWMSWRVKIPGLNSVHDYGMMGYDSVIGNLRLNIPAMGKLGVTVGVQGRRTIFSDASDWAFVGSLEDGDSIPESGSGHVKIGGTEYPIVGMTLDIINNLTRFQDEMEVGDYSPAHFVPLSRAVQVRIMYKYENPALCSQIYTGKVDANSVWDQLPFYTETKSGVKGFEASFYGPGKVGSTAKRYGLHIYGNRVSWRMDGGIQIQAGRFLIVPFTGTFILPDSGEYVEIALENDEVGSFYQVNNPITLTMANSASFSGTAVKMDVAATVSQYADSGWTHGALIAEWGTPSGGTLDADDVLSVDTTGNFDITNGDLIHDSGTPKVVGTVSGGTHDSDLRIVFNDNMTTTIAQELVRAIQYNNAAGSTPSMTFNVTLKLVDANSEIATKVVAITHS